MNKVLNILGIAKRAGKLILGTDSVIKNLPRGIIKMIILASDVSHATFDKFDKKSYFYQVKVVTNFTTEELSKALGVTMTKVVAITDDGFAKAIEKELERGDC